MDNKVLSILHDHYKESFANIREREKRRDRLFITTVLIFGALFLEINYPVDFQGALGDLSIIQTEINLGTLPFASILSITWTLLLVVTLLYGQSSIAVERQYDYLHILEEEISKSIGNEEIYCREGRAYIDNYPAFSNWVWIFYVGIFPAIVLVSVGTLLYIELCNPALHWPYKAYDVFAGLAVGLSYFLYRFLPLIKGRKES